MFIVITRGIDNFCGYVDSECGSSYVYGLWIGFFLFCFERLSNYGKYVLVLDRLPVSSIISILLSYRKMVVVVLVVVMEREEMFLEIAKKLVYEIQYSHSVIFENFVRSVIE